MRARLGRVVLWAAALAATTTTVAHAQLSPGARPRFGHASLRRGFTPDPHVLEGQLGGPIAAGPIHSGCNGHISARPSHVIRTATGFGQLRLVVAASSDATLMVMLPNGQILCDDDGGEGMNPLLSTSSPPGAIRVWVGAYSQSSTGEPYRLGVTELASVTASQLGGAPGHRPTSNVVNGAAPPLFGRLQLRSGFTPDPHIVSGTAGGPVDASALGGGCRGHVTPRPSHVLMTPTGFSTLRVVAHAEIDTTLVVMLPDGRVVCDDDGGDGTNALVNTRTQAGPIRVWVGTYSNSQQGPYNLGFSELSRVGTANVPLPSQAAPNRPSPPLVQGLQGGQPGIAGQLQGPSGTVVSMEASIPVTLMGPGLAADTVAIWDSHDQTPTRIQLSGRSVVVGGVTVASIPPTMNDPVVTVTERRNGALVVRAEQAGSGRGDPGQAMLLLVRWRGGPTVVRRWTGTARQRGPRWGR